MFGGGTNPLPAVVTCMNAGMADRSERPLVLVWEVTQACELACEHCRASAEPDRHPAELSTAEGKRLLEDVRAFGSGQIVVLSGGDPLARPDLKELVAYGTDLGLCMTLTPSGTASLTDERVQTLADAGLRRMALSLDGASAAAHDGFRGESGSFAATVEAARSAQSVGIPLQINTTVCARTAPSLADMPGLLADLETVLWSVFFLVPVGRGRHLEPVGADQAEAIMQWLLAVEERSAMAVKTTEAPHYRRVAIEHSSESAGPDRRRGIVAGDGFAFVSHTGTVYPSGFLPLAAGSVRDDDIVNIYREAPLFRSLRDREQLTGKCGACSYRSVCGGSRSRAFATTGDPLEADPLCPHRPAGYDGPVPTQTPFG